MFEYSSAPVRRAGRQAQQTTEYRGVVVDVGETNGPNGPQQRFRAQGLQVKTSMGSTLGCPIGPERKTPQEAYLDFVENEKNLREQAGKGPGWRCCFCGKIFDVFMVRSPFTQGLNELVTWKCPGCVANEDDTAAPVPDPDKVMSDDNDEEGGDDGDEDEDEDEDEMRKNPKGDSSGYYRPVKRRAPNTFDDDSGGSDGAGAGGEKTASANSNSKSNNSKSNSNSSGQPSPKRNKPEQTLSSIGSLQQNQMKLYGEIIEKEKEIEEIRAAIATKKEELKRVESGLSSALSTLRESLG